MTYQEYLQTEHWRLLRGAKLQISETCQVCGTRKNLEVHHRIYRASWFDTELSDLDVLCHDHHIDEHAKDWVPKSQEELKPIPEKITLAIKCRLDAIQRQLLRTKDEKKREKIRRRIDRMIAGAI